MSNELQIPESPLTPDHQYPTLPATYKGTLDAAFTAHDEQLPNGPGSGWADAGEKQGVKLQTKPDVDAPDDVPWVRGTTIIEGVTPEQLCWTTSLPSVRKLWDGRYDFGVSTQRFGPEISEFYTVMQAPSFMVWARDIVGIQAIRSYETETGNTEYRVVQTSIDDEERFPVNGSYASKRTRAEVVLSAWLFKPVTTESEKPATEVTYIVRTKLNGWLPTSLLSTLASEIPLCVGRVRDTVYEIGTTPYFVRSHPDGSRLPQAVVDKVAFQLAPRQWYTSVWVQQPQPIVIQYDQHQFPDPSVTLSGVEDATSAVDKVKQQIIVTVPAEAVGKKLEITIFTK